MIGEHASTDRRATTASRRSPLSRLETSAIRWIQGAAALYERALPRDSRRRWWFLNFGSGLGWALLIWALLYINRVDGGLGFDSHSYYLAGRHILENQPLYTAVAINDFGPYRYPPLFAQLIAPLTLVPEAPFTWAIRAISLVSMRYIAGSWRAMGWWFLFPLLGFPAVNEIVVAGIVFPVAALTLASLRGKEELAPWAVALHIGPIVVLPFLWFRRNKTRLLVGLLTLAAACAVSAAANPQSWVDYVASLFQQASSSTDAVSLIRLMPTALSDFAWRLALALLIVFVAIRRNTAWLAFAAHVVAAPTLWPSRLVPLLAVPRLAVAEESSRPALETAPTPAEATS